MCFSIAIDPYIAHSPNPVPRSSIFCGTSDSGASKGLMMVSFLHQALCLNQIISNACRKGLSESLHCFQASLVFIISWLPTSVSDVGKQWVYVTYHGSRDTKYLPRKGSVLVTEGVKDWLEESLSHSKSSSFRSEGSSYWNPGGPLGPYPPFGVVAVPEDGIDVEFVSWGWSPSITMDVRVSLSFVCIISDSFRDTFRVHGND